MKLSTILDSLEKLYGSRGLKLFKERAFIVTKMKKTQLNVEILGMLSLYHSFLVSFSVEILGMFRY